MKNLTVLLKKLVSLNLKPIVMLLLKVRKRKVYKKRKKGITKTTFKSQITIEDCKNAIHNNKINMQLIILMIVGNTI